MFYANGTEDVSEYQHEVLLATLKDRSVYVVDLAGAQYGYYHEPVIPLATYQGSRAKEIRLSKSQPLGYQRQLVKQQCVDNGTWEAAIRNGHEQFYQCFNEAVETWQRVRMPLLAMLKLNDEEFLENQNSLVIHVEAHLLEYRKYAETHGHFKVQMIPHHVMGQGGEPERSERSFEDEVAELLGNAAFIDHEILDLRGMGF